MSVHAAAASRRPHPCLRALLVTAVMVLAVTPGAVAQPAPGEVVIAWHVTIAPSCRQFRLIAGPNSSWANRD